MRLKTLHMTSPNSIFHFLLLLLIFGCQAPQARKAQNKSSDAFLKQSALRNKDRFADQNKALETVAKTDDQHQFQKGEKGYYYAASGGRATQKDRPVKGDWVKISYQIEDLSGNILYDFKEVATENFLVDREDVLPALREGVKHLRKGEVGVFLFPSYLCYGYQGDGDKIGVSQPLKIYIHLLDHQKN